VIVIPYDTGFSQIEIDGVKITGGVAAGGDGGEFFGWEKGGGALRILGSGTAASSVTLTDDDLTGNLAHAEEAMGGAIFNKRTLNVIDSTIAHNIAHADSPGNEFGEAYGGGIFNTGHLLIADSTIADNTVEAGGVKSEAVGGGVDSGVEDFSNEASTAIANTTITGNIASAGTTEDRPYVYGGGVAIDGGALNHVTLYGNTASPINAEASWGGNVYEPQGGGAWINNSIVADGSASEGPNCMFQSGGSYAEDNRNDLEDDPNGECGFSVDYGSLVGIGPGLTPLADNGGPTETLAPMPGSPVIDAGAGCEGTVAESGSDGWTTATVPLDVDQRGMPRNGHCDIGAFQTEPPFATSVPEISGTPEVGHMLTCGPGSWTGEGTLSYSYEWLRDGVSSSDRTTTYTILPTDAGAQLACLVTVTGTYGPTEATSASLEVPKPLQSPPSRPLEGHSDPASSSADSDGAPDSDAGSPPTADSGAEGTGTSQPANANSAQVATLLAAQLASSRSAAKIAQLVRRGGLTITFTAALPGTVTIDWYRMPAGKAHATKPLLVATGRYTFAAASAAKIRIKLTASGKLLLRHSSQLKLTVEGVFTSIGKPTISASRTFYLTW
jgi:hypothetical protein